MKKIIGAMSIMAILATAGFAQDAVKKECTEQEKAHANHGKRGGMMADIPNLTEDQKKMMKEIREEGKKNVQPQREQLKVIKEKIHVLKTADDPNIKEINQLIDESHKLKAEMDKAKLAQHMKFRSILTPEQLEVADAKMKEKRDRHEKMRKERKERKEAK